MPPFEQTDRIAVLVVAFEGDCPNGSAGNAHGRYIASETMRGIHAFDPRSVVLDFRRLAYRWGDSLLKVFHDISQLKDAGREPGEPAFPIAVVTSALSRDGFISLVTPSGASQPDWIFDDMDVAIDYGVRASKAWLSF